MSEKISLDSSAIPILIIHSIMAGMKEMYGDLA